MGKQGFWDENLLELQRQYWQRWSEIGSTVTGQAAAKSPWEMAQEHWWQAIAPVAPANAKEFMTKMMEQGAHFFRMAELFSSGDGQQPPWTDLLDQLGEQMRGAATSADSAAAGEQVQKLMGFWSTPMEGWQQMVSTLSFGQDGPFNQSGSIGNPFSPERLLNMPGFGLAREEQAEQQKLARLYAEYQQALQAYNHFFTDLGSEAVKRLQEELQQLAGKGEKIESGRALYDIWVSTCEAVYAERVVDDAYAGINGNLINSSMRVKQQLGSMVDDYLGSMNMPTRRELRTLQQRMQENRRESKRVRAELEELKRSLQALNADQTKISASSTSKKRQATKAAVKKRAVRQPAAKKRVAKKST